MTDPMRVTLTHIATTPTLATAAPTRVELTLATAPAPLAVELGLRGPKGVKGDAGPQGERGEIGPQGPPGDIGARVFHIDASETSWSITHNIGRYPVVTMVDSAGSVLIANVCYLDVNTVVVSITAPMTGAIIMS